MYCRWVEGLSIILDHVCGRKYRGAIGPSIGEGELGMRREDIDVIVADAVINDVADVVDCG